MKIFHTLPVNPTVSGGMKVVYQLVSLERELGYDSCIVYPDGTAVYPKWFKYDVNHISVSQMNKYADKKNDLIVGWENNDELLYRSGFRNKVMYIQGEVFINRSKPYHGLDIWFSSKFNEMMLPQFANHNTYFVSPFIDRSRFFYDPIGKPRETTLLVQARKDGRGAFNKLRAASNFSGLSDKLNDHTMAFLPDVNEVNFAEALCDSMFFFAHSYPEGLGLCPLEAMACGSIVFGFSGGGGTDFMDNGINCFVANRDGDYEQLAALVNIAMNQDATELETMKQAALSTVNVYSRERTKNQLEEALSLYGS